MKLITLYQCEYCNFRGTKDECEAHEAKHLKLTLDEYRHWKKLDETVKQASHNVSMHKNNQTEAAFDKAIKDQLAFEQVHGLI